MAGGLDEEQAAVDAGVLDVTLALGGELLAQVGRVLVLNVLHDGVPARCLSAQRSGTLTRFHPLTIYRC